MTQVLQDRPSLKWRRDAQAAPADASASRWRNISPLAAWTWGLIALGITWRVLRYLLRFPIWADEAMLSLSFVDRDFEHLFAPLKYIQVAPPFFIVWETAAIRWFGTSELVVRLLPLLASIGSLFLFKRLADKVLSPLGAALAVSVLAMSVWPASMANLLKPYSLDLFASLLFLTPAVHYLQAPRQARWLWMLAAVAPLTLSASFPSLFIVSAVSVALLGAVWRERSAAVLLGYTAFMASWLGTFAILYVFWISQTPAHIMEVMRDFWADGFPPTAPLKLIGWLLAKHTGQMFAYPIGESNGGSIVTAAAFVGGLVVFAREKRWSLVLLCTIPFALGLAASAVHRYPYGQAARLSQHLAGIICLAAGAGGAAFLERVAKNPANLNRWTTPLFCGLACLGLAFMARDVAKPYRHSDDVWKRKVVAQVFSQVEPGDLVIVGPTAPEESVFAWYLEPHADQIVYLDKLTDAQLAAAKDHVWLLYCQWSENPDWVPTDDVPGVARLANKLEKTNPAWRLTDKVPYVYYLDGKDRTFEYCLVSRWTRPGVTPKRNLIAQPE